MSFDFLWTRFTQLLRLDHDEYLFPFNLQLLLYYNKTTKHFSAVSFSTPKNEWTHRNHKYKQKGYYKQGKKEQQRARCVLIVIRINLRSKFIFSFLINIIVIISIHLPPPSHMSFVGFFHRSFLDLLLLFLFTYYLQLPSYWDRPSCPRWTAWRYLEGSASPCARPSTWVGR